jgi:flagellar biosynthesis regulator FlaF
LKPPCWAHARRKFFELARINKAPIASDAVKRIDALFAIEREINGLAPAQRVAERNERSRPLIDALETWLREQRARVSKNSDTGKAIDYSLKRWTELTRFLDDGRLCMTNNAAERELRAVALGRRNWTFAGSDEGGRRAAALYTLIATAKLNDVPRKLGSPMYWPGYQTTRHGGSAIYYRGIGAPNTVPQPEPSLRNLKGVGLDLPLLAVNSRFVTICSAARTPFRRYPACPRSSRS